MKIVLIGATGFVGSVVLKEALQRGHELTAVCRHPEKIPLENQQLHGVSVDIFNTEKLAEVMRGSDVIISAYNPGWTNPLIYEDYIRGARSIQAAAVQSGTRRLIVVGGAGSLFVGPGKQLVDSPDFPQAWKPGARAARDYLDILKKAADLDWTFLSPAIEMNAGSSGSRTGAYRTGGDEPVLDQHNRSIISVEDLAVALLDEAERPAHVRRRFTVAY